MTIKPLILIVIALFIQLSAYAEGPIRMITLGPEPVMTSEALHLNIHDPLSVERRAQIQELLTGADVLLIASEHNPDFEAFVRELTLQINQMDSAYNCKYWEEDALFADAMELGMTDFEAFYDAFYREAVRLVYLYEERRGQGYMPTQMIPDRIRPLFDQGIRSIPIDPLFADEAWLTRAVEAERSYSSQQVAEVFINERNPLFAQQIVTSREDGRCQKGIFSIGAHHLDTQFGGHEVRPVQDYLHAEGVSTQIIYLTE